jgi:hypothetical protein
MAIGGLPRNGGNYQKRQTTAHTECKFINYDHLASNLGHDIELGRSSSLRCNPPVSMHFHLFDAPRTKKLHQILPFNAFRRTHEGKVHPFHHRNRVFPLLRSYRLLPLHTSRRIVD